MSVLCSNVASGNSTMTVRFFLKFALALLLYSATNQCLKAKDLPFFKGDFQSLQSEALKTEKPYFIFVHNPGQSKSVMMRKEYLASETFLSFVESNYLAYQVKGTKRKNWDFTRKYRISSFPSVLIFSSEGKLLAKLSGYLSPQDLMIELEKYVITPEPQMTVVYSYHKSPINAPIKEELIPVSRGAEEENLSQYKSIPVFRNGKLIKKVALAVPGFAKYSLAPVVYQKKAFAFGLMIGNYSDLQELRDQVSRFERIWKKEIYVYSIESRGTQMYKLILGNFDRKHTASCYAESIYRIENVMPELINLLTIAR